MLMKIRAGDIWHTTEMDCAVAEELFGWRWLAFDGIPVRGTPGYPEKQRVRRFFPPDKELGERWQEYFAEVNVAPASGDEPLDYAYCSSSGTHMVPHFSGHRDAAAAMERELQRRGLFQSYCEQLAVQSGRDNPHDAIAFADCASRCISALAVVGSKHVSDQPDSRTVP